MTNKKLADLNAQLKQGNGLCKVTLTPQGHRRWDFDQIIVLGKLMNASVLKNLAQQVRLMRRRQWKAPAAPQ